MVRDLRRARENDDAYPDVVFVFKGTPEAGEAFFARHWSGAEAISDPDGILYEAFSIRRGGLLEIAGPAVWWRGLRALWKRNGVGRPGDDVRVMPGLFLLRHGRIAWTHEFRTSADHPDFAAIPALAAVAHAPD